MIHSPPEVVPLAVDLHEHLIQMPLPLRICAHLTAPFPANISGKYWAKSVPPKSNRLMADVDTAFIQKVLHVPKRKREANIRYYGQADDL